MKTHLIGLTLLVLFSCGPTDQQSALHDQKELHLVYISNRGTGFDLYRNDSTGMNEYPLTNLTGWEWSPQPVQDGMLYFNNQDTSGQFSQRAINRFGEILEFDLAGPKAFTLSPDNKWGAYSLKKEGNTNIWLCELETKDSLQVTNVAGYNGRMKWSGNSRKLAFISDRTSTNEVYVFDLDERVTTRLTNNEKREKYLTWSPDYSKIAVTMTLDEDLNDIFLVDVNTLSVSQLTYTPDINESEIAWAPVGDLMAYHAKVDGRDDIFTLNLQSKKTKRITSADAYHGEPVWWLD